MGTLLLQGWAMLEECCDECNVPLMRNRTKDKEVCVQCDKNFKADTAAPVVTSQPASQPAQKNVTTSATPQNTAINQVIETELAL